MIGFIIGTGVVCLAGFCLFIFALCSAVSDADDALLGDEQYR
jgi:hypothetical protein